jgi:hypothetical protein
MSLSDKECGLQTRKKRYMWGDSVVKNRGYDSQQGSCHRKISTHEGWGQVRAGFHAKVQRRKGFGKIGTTNTMILMQQGVRNVLFWITDEAQRTTIE